MRLGIFGGTFDPPHVGHLLAASDACDILELDQLLFVPARVQPFKVGRVHASPAQRLEMLRLTAGPDPRLAVDAVEIDRDGLSYTVETLRTLAARYPAYQRFLIIGSDLAREIVDWHQSDQIPALAEIAVLQREGDPAPEPAVGSSPPFAIRRLATRRVDVSSTEVRERVRAGRSIHGFVTDGVAEYIQAAGLYR